MKKRVLALAVTAAAVVPLVDPAIVIGNGFWFQ